jgi:hypothetical protein
MLFASENDSFASLVMSKPVDHSGFTPPGGRALGNERRIAALAELVATAALALCTVVAATVVSVGIARAHGIAATTGSDGSLYGIALLLVLIVIGVGGYAVRPPRQHMSR